MDWASAETELDTVCADIFDVSDLSVRPRKGGVGPNHPRSDDADRQPFDFKGTIDLQPSGDLLARHRSPDPASGSANPYFEAVLTALSAGWAYQPRKFDWVLDGAVIWEIVAEAKDGGERRAWYLNKVKNNAGS